MASNLDRTIQKLLIPRVYRLPRCIVGFDDRGEQVRFPVIYEGPFGLHSRQKRGQKAIYNQELWFNGEGEWLGIGSLSWDDFKRIAQEIPKSELFVICRRSAFNESQLRLSIHNPNPRFLLSFCEVVIRQKEVLFISGSELDQFLIKTNNFLRNFLKRIIGQEFLEDRMSKSPMYLAGITYKRVALLQLMQILEDKACYSVDLLSDAYERIQVSS